MAKSCVYCGAVLDEEMRFCTVCGNPVLTPSTEATCPQCGAAMEGAFCTNCGASAGAAPAAHTSIHKDPAPVGEEPVEPKPVENLEKKRCPHCGAEIDGDCLFCTGCGHRLEEVPEEKPVSPMPDEAGRVCTHCGAQYSPETCYCANCGHRVDGKQDTEEQFFFRPGDLL